MKRFLLLLTMFVGLTALAGQHSADRGNSVAFTEAQNYFFKNGQEIPADAKITTQEDFTRLFGMAAFMGNNGKPTAIDFSRSIVIAIVLPTTDIATDIKPVALCEKDENLFYDYSVTKGEKLSYTIRPISIIVIDKKYENHKLIIKNKEFMKENMEEVQAYLKECGAFFIATADGDMPRVRPFGVSEIINGKLYIMTGKVKDVFKQLAKNGKFEICALKPSGSEWMRVSGSLVNDDDLDVKRTFLDRNPGLKSMYKADDDNMAVLYIENGTARFCSFTAPERKVAF